MKAQTIQSLFEDQAEARPDAVAVIFGDKHLTYAQLNRDANRLAHYLKAKGVGLETPVGICIDRNIDMLTGILGIIKAGGAYVPMDPGYPQKRLAAILKDSGSPMLLTQSSLQTRLPEFHGETLFLDRDDHRFADRPQTNPDRGAAATNLAYIIYTSGSTGSPKGVAVPHGAVLRLVCDTDYFQIEHTDRIAQASNVSFDAATFEFWGTLLHGASLVGIGRDALLNPHDFAEFLTRHAITGMFITTALFNQMARNEPNAFRGLRALLFGGEAVDPGWVRRVLQKDPPKRLVHVYGPTETTTFATWFEVKEVVDGAVTVPIGHPIANTRTYVFDGDLQPVPVGGHGDLYIGGAGLARGYKDDPALTAERFIPNPFTEEPGARLYRTGDWVRPTLRNGIEFLGRIDDQVKIHGFRIEPAEIEAVLCLHPGIDAAAVVVLPDPNKQKRLVAYLMLNQEQQPTRPEIKSYLGARIPDYMYPHVYIVLDRFPLTPNGKVDRRALPPPDWRKRQAEVEFLAPRTAVEEILSGIYADILGLESVGREDDFYQLGGHSLNATQIVSRIRDVFHIEIPLQSVFEKPTILDLAAHLQEEIQQPRAVTTEAITPVPRNRRLPLSAAQERVWFIQQLDKDNRAYYFHATFEFEGRLDAAVLEKSLSEVVKRHEILRTTFPLDGDAPVQMIHPAKPVSLPVVDLRELSEAKRNQHLWATIDREFAKPFHIDCLPLIRWMLIRLDDAHYIMTHAEHHLIHDGWSFNVFLDDLFHFYRMYTEDGIPAPEEPGIQFADFAAWQRLWERSQEARDQLAYWRKQLAGSPPVLELPIDHPRPAQKGFQGALLKNELPGTLFKDLTALSREAGVTLFMTLLAGLLIVLRRYSGQEDICVGTGMAARRRTETEKLLGMIINNVVLRAHAPAGLSILELLKQIRSVVLDAADNQDLPFDSVVNALQPERSLGYNPLFQVMFDVHDAPMPEIMLPGLTCRLQLGLSNGASKFDLTIIVIPSSAEHFGDPRQAVPEGLSILWEYDTALFTTGTVEQMMGHYRNVLEAMVADPQQDIAALPRLTDRQRQQQLIAWNRTTVDYPADRTIPELFQEQVQKTPDKLALSCGSIHLSYAQLNERANRLGRFLQRHGVGPEVIVGTYLDRSPELVIAVLGILKAGGAYLPLDTDLPPKRLAFILGDTGAPVLLTRAGLSEGLPDYGGAVIELDVQWQEISMGSGDNLNPQTTADNLCYVMFTSGSTGRPKGVSVVHRNVIRLVKSANYVSLGPEEVMLQFAPASFDASTFEIWGSLLNGGKLIVFPDQKPSLEDLGRFISQSGITTLWLTAALFHQMVDDHIEYLRPVRQLLAGGEALSASHVRKMIAVLGPNRLINGYGPTENTTFTTCHPMTEKTRILRSVPIGVPISNTQVYVLDTYMNPVPQGVYGELFVGGDGLARGYFNRPERTAACFVPHPFSQDAGARLYKSGDIVRLLPDGSLDYRGRNDDQVKLRGFRIELGEIESTLALHASVKDAAVLCREDVAGDKRLVAYVVPDPAEGCQNDALRHFMVQMLPGYMIPSAFVQIDELPVTPNGKVDRQALPLPGRGQKESEKAVVPPHTKTQKEIEKIWREILNLDEIGIHDNFFSLGGHSLHATRVISRIRKFLHLELPLGRLFEFPTIAGLAAFVDAAGRDASQAKQGDFLKGEI